MRVWVATPVNAKGPITANHRPIIHKSSKNTFKLYSRFTAPLPFIVPNPDKLQQHREYNGAARTWNWKQGPCSKYEAPRNWKQGICSRHQHSPFTNQRTSRSYWFAPNQTNKSSEHKQQTIKHQPSTTSIHRDHHHRTESVHHSDSSGSSNNEIDSKRPPHRMFTPLFFALYHQQNSIVSLCSTARICSFWECVCVLTLHSLSAHWEYVSDQIGPRRFNVNTLLWTAITPTSFS